MEDFLWRNAEAEKGITLNVELKRKAGRSKGIHPSAACKVGACLLKLYYDCTSEVEPKTSYDGQSFLTWDIGTILHELHQTYFHLMYGDQFSSEVYLSDTDLLIHSSTDGLFSFTQYRAILEMKTIKENGNYGWEKIQIRPFEDNVRQTHFYMKLADVPFSLLLYICKNNSQYKEHAFAFDSAIWASIRNDIVDPVVKAVKENKATAAAPGWACKMCSYKHGCPSVKRSNHEVPGTTTWGRYN
jgi:hypothetical protein